MHGRIKVRRVARRWLPAVAALAAAWAALALPESARATLLAYEGFDYETGSLFDENGGSGWGGAWTGSTGNVNVVDDAALTYTDSHGQVLVTSGRGATITRGSRQGIRALNANYASGTYWISFLFQPTYVLGPDNVIYLALQGSTDTGDTIVNVGKVTDLNESSFPDDNPDAINYGLDFDDGTMVFSNVTGEDDELRFFVIKYVIGSTTDDGSIHLFIDPDLGAEPLEANAAVSLTGLSSSVMAFNAIGIYAPSGADGATLNNRTGHFDEIRLGTRFADVAPVPEPASAAVVAAGIGCVIVPRRRKQPM